MRGDYGGAIGGASNGDDGLGGGGGGAAGAAAHSHGGGGGGEGAAGEGRADAGADDSARAADNGADAGGGGDGGVVSAVSNVVMFALGTANAAAAAVSHVGEQLAAAAGVHSCRPPKPDWPHRPLDFITPPESAAWPVGCAGDAAVVRAGGEALCRALARLSRHRELVVTLVDDDADDADADRRALGAFLSGAPAGQVIVFARGARRRERARVGGRRRGGDGDGASSAVFEVGARGSPLHGLPHVALKYALLRGVLRAGASALYAHPRTKWGRDGANVFGYVSRDVDLEAPSGGASSALAHGRVVSVDDAQMGWSRYAQSLAMSPLSPHLFYASATGAAAALMGFVEATFAAADGGAKSGPERAPRSEAYELTREAVAPAHDAKRSAGASYRVMAASCFGVGRGAIASAVDDGRRRRRRRHRAALDVWQLERGARVARL